MTLQLRNVAMGLAASLLVLVSAKIMEGAAHYATLLESPEQFANAYGVSGTSIVCVSSGTR